MKPLISKEKAMQVSRAVMETIQREHPGANQRDVGFILSGLAVACVRILWRENGAEAVQDWLAKFSETVNAEIDRLRGFSTSQSGLILPP